MVMPLGIIILERKMHTRLGTYLSAYICDLTFTKPRIHCDIIFIISLTLTGIIFSITSEQNCRYIILTSLTHGLLSKDNSSSQFPSRTTHYIIFPTISPFGLDGNHDGVLSPQWIDTLIITIIQTPWYSPPLTSREKGGPKQGFSSLVEIWAL